MRALLQRVSFARVSVGNGSPGRLAPVYWFFLGSTGQTKERIYSS